MTTEKKDALREKLREARSVLSYYQDRRRVYAEAAQFITQDIYDLRRELGE